MKVLILLILSPLLLFAKIDEKNIKDNDFKKAVSIIKKSFKENGNKIDENVWERAIPYLKKACARNHSMGYFFLGGLQRDLKLNSDSNKSFGIACKLGSSDGCEAKYSALMSILMDGSKLSKSNQEWFCRWAEKEKRLTVFTSCPNQTARKIESCKHTSKSFRCVKYISNYDGDTIKFKIPNTHPLFGQGIAIRINGLDAAEIKAKDKCEKNMAQIAKEVVGEKLKKATQINLINIKRGKYFRIVADVIYDGKNLKDELMNHHLAYEYDAKAKKKINWCNQYKVFSAGIRGGSYEK